MFVAAGLLTAIAIGAAAGVVGFVGYSMWQEYRSDRVPALLYHHFIAAGADTHVSCDPVYFCYDTAFEQQLEYLRREGYTTITLDEFIAFQNRTGKLPPKPIMLTFDDGFASNYEMAFPLLKRYGMKATIFVTPDRTSRNFAKYAHLDRPLSDEQLLEMSACGMAIESHGMTHRYLSTLERDAVRWELSESRAVLERLLAKPVRFIAIPSGAYSRMVKRLVKETGYAAAFCMSKGTNHRGSDPFGLRRIPIGRDFTLPDFRRVLQPRTACYLRVTGAIQDTLLMVLGPSRLDAFRARLYRSRLGTSIIRGQLRPVVPAVLVLVLVALALSLWVLAFPGS